MAECAPMAVTLDSLPVSSPPRAHRTALVGLSLLVQPRMFDGAWYVIGAGAVLAIAAIAWEWMRGRQLKTA